VVVRDLLLGCVYIPPENSLYSSINAFLDIENELVNLIEKDMKCALIGDFNAKTAFLKVFVQNYFGAAFTLSISF
jgi:hypothetical protein